MDSAARSSPKKVRRKRTPGPYKGVRMRSWGRWVSEIRIPKTKKRIWLGSYDSPEKAARAYDAALYCVRGARGRFNFPTNKRPELPDGSAGSLSKKDVKAIAASFASPDASMPSPMSSSITTQVSLDMPILAEPPVSSEIGSAWEVGGESFAPAGVPGVATNLQEILQLDDLVMLDTDWIMDLI